MVTLCMRSAASALLIVSFLSLGASDLPPAALQRQVAVTFDDLPAVTSLPLSGQRTLTQKLLRSIRSARVPAVGFVNEDKLRTPGHTALLQPWLTAGLELGNHTYSHGDLHRGAVADYEADIVRGERVTRSLLRDRGLTLRWFRHPFLHTGTSLETKQRVERFLTSHGYRVAPVTLDNSEWIFARAYELANDGATRKRVGEAYVLYMDQKLAYFEQQSQKLFERNIRHVLLLHANALNADWFDDLAASMRARGYGFITLDQALEDPAYRSADTYTGRGGISWIHRWALTAGRPKEFFAGEPATPQWVQQLARIAE